MERSPLRQTLPRRTLLTAAASAVALGTWPAEPVGAVDAAWRHHFRVVSRDNWAAWSRDGSIVDAGALKLDLTAGLAGGAESPVVEINGGFDELIPSWIATTPTGTWIEVSLAIRVAGQWSKAYNLGVWAATSEVKARHSVRNQNDDFAKIETDTLIGRRRADAYRVSVRLVASGAAATASIKRLNVAASRRDTTPIPPTRPGPAEAIDLPVDPRSQMIYPNGGPVWCSPTSTSMVMAYWAEFLDDDALDVAVPAAAEATYDAVYRGHGNWPFNVAFAGAHGLDGFVTRLYNLDQLETWIRVGVPVVISLAWETGELANAAIPRTGGHLLVVRGFTETGDAIVNDPAANPNLGQSVRRVYARDQLESVWLKHSGGVVYLIMPDGWPTPTVASHGAW